MKQRRHFVVDVLFVLALFGVFAVSALTLVLIGADVYRHTVNDMNRNYDTRTAAAYITEKVRQNDCSVTSNGDYIDGAVAISSLDDLPAILLTRELEGEIYCTYLYLYGGYLKELFMRQGSSLGSNAADAGQNIMPLSDLRLEQVSAHLLKVSLTTQEGEEHQLMISTRSE